MRFDEILDQAIEQATCMDATSYQAFWGSYLSEAYLLAGRIQKATEQANRALDLPHEYKKRGNEAYVLRLLGDLTMHNDLPEIDQAETHYNKPSPWVLTRRMCEKRRGFWRNWHKF